MDEKQLIPIQAKIVKDPDGNEKIKAVVPMNLMFSKHFDSNFLELELLKFERRYFYLVTCLRSLKEFLKSLNQSGKRVLIYWEFGNKIIEFIKEYTDSVFVIKNFQKSITRDVGVSDKFVNRCKKFRINYPDLTEIDPIRSFDSYVAKFESGYITRKRQVMKNDKK